MASIPLPNIRYAYAACVDLLTPYSPGDRLLADTQQQPQLAGKQFADQSRDRPAYPGEPDGLYLVGLRCAAGPF